MEAVLDFGWGRQNLLYFCLGGVWGGLPSANPDNVAAGGATDARCGHRGSLGGGGGVDM